MIFADMALDLGSLVMWLVVGLSAVWLAGRVMDEPSYGSSGDLLLGLAGALIGGLGFGFFVTGDPSFWGAFLVAILGACILIAVVRVVTFYRNA
jgi:uncharacterized membrane protein YeaQ/YmgE (transglycosylase-associated protein family)